MFQIKPHGKPPLDLEVEINFAAIKRVKSMLGINLTDLTEGDPPLVARLSMEEMLICDVLYCVCKPQLDAAGITDEMFGQALGGDAFAEGASQLDRGLEDFFQKLRRGEKAAMLRAQRKAMQTAIRVGEMEIDEMPTPDLAAIRREISTKLKSHSQSGSGSTSSPASLELPPIPSASENLSGCAAPDGGTNGTAPV